MHELAHHLPFYRILEGAPLLIAGDIKHIFQFPQIMIEVIGADFINEGVGVVEENLDVVRIFHLHHVILDHNVTSEMGLERM